MRYKHGDKVKIKTWKELEKEFGTYEGNQENFIKCCQTNFVFNMEIDLNKLNTNRIITIEKVFDNWPYGDKDYQMKEIGGSWTDDMIECLVKNKIETLEPINSRWEILDL